MSRPILLDTCALLWIANNETLRPEAEAALQQMAPVLDGILVSPISAWEIGQLASRGRLRLAIDPLRWFQRSLDRGMALAPLPVSVLVASAFLPGDRLRDPADKILAATARQFGYRLMTRDLPLLDLSAEGHLDAIAC
ncbi:type II toxin-antitoxin system VapC family toxin [Phenylobacterium sp.]|uniref:type II toxin-antitoxin system VapC family toxin n=1 Tax=Phenylobacterium sp. TaxID=1871053 RepID=UPI0025E1F4FE|nr:type II toxin-antitoxin system VapC family toxin [Phenylobacterium sp.]